MIFVTVGTHEQPFNRLIKKVDELIELRIIEEDVIMQTGFSTYEPRHCQWKKLFPYDEMTKNINEARIVITHGGPASFIMPLQIGKIPIVVPRQKKYGEHVNDHQMDFVKAVSNRMRNIIPVFNIEELQKAIVEYEEDIDDMNIEKVSHNKQFNDRFILEIKKLFGEDCLLKNKI